MSALFFDTSALAKRYLNEIGSAWSHQLIQPAAEHVIIVSEILVVEMSSLLARRVREATVSAATAASLESIFLQHVNDEYLTIALQKAVLTHACAVVKTYPLRTLDAIQLASALRAGAILSEQITFLSSDRNLLAAATAEGLLVDNPLLHP